MKLFTSKYIINYRVLPLNSKQIVCYSADGNLCILNLKKPSKIFKS